MSDKAFEAFKKDNNHAMQADYIAFGVLAIIKWVKRAWQAATAAERKRIVKLIRESKFSDVGGWSPQEVCNALSAIADRLEGK